jgi:putative ABC transport system substrate-binding protein
MLTFDEGDREGRARLAAFLAALATLGWVEGRNLRIEYRWPRLDAERMRRHATELAALQPHLIVAHNTPATLALLQQTRSIPIVFFQASDPVGRGMVASVARPGGNVTGFIDLEGSLGGKWLELLKEIAPRVAQVAVLFNPATATYADYYLSPFRAAAASLGVEGIAAPVGDASAIEPVIAAQARRPNGGLIAMPEAFTGTHRMAITALASRYRVPAVYPFRFFAALGGLLSYGIDLVDHYRRAAAYVDRILRGTRPGELPVQFPVKFELVINSKAARALSLAIPQSLLVRADEVIE